MNIIQTNAIRSWTLLRPECEIILFANEEGTAEIARKLGVKHVPEVECNEYGTPLLDSVFSQAQNIGRHELMCFVSGDIILMNDFLPAVQRVHKNRFLMVGLRWDLGLNEPIDFDNAQWELHLRERLAKYGKPHPPGGGGDYCIFPRGLFDNIPPFAIGRTALDNWLVYKAREMRIPVIDATKAIVYVHQNHDYSHIQIGAGDPDGGLERERNIELMGGTDRAFTTEYATHLLTHQRPRPALSLRHIYFRMRALAIINPRFHFLLTLFKTFEKLVRSVRSARTEP